MSLRATAALLSLGGLLWSQSAFSAYTPPLTFRVVVQYDDGRLATVQETGHTAAGAVAAARSRSHVVHAEPDVTYQLALVPNDPAYSAQVQLAHIGAPVAWDTRTSAEEVVVAVLDSGVDITNPDLVSNVWTNTDEVPSNGIDDDQNGYIDDRNGWNFIEQSADPRPQQTPGATLAGLHHGTVVAGIIGAAGNNTLGSTGVAWNVRILPVRVLDSTGSGSTVTVAQGIAYAVAQGADVINLSFVGSGSSSTLEAAIANAQAADVVVVAAAGNENLDLAAVPQYPACYNGVIGVASVNSADVKSSFSNYGPCVDIAAPGENITSTLYYAPSSGYSAVTGGGWYGTSVASPFVAGTFALVRASMPTASLDSMQRVVRDHAVSIADVNPGYVNALGAGRVHLATLLSDISATVATRPNILVAPRAGDTPRVRVYSEAGKLIRQFLGAPERQQQGLVVRSGDVTGDGQAEIITGQLRGTEPRVRVYSSTGTHLRTFLAFPKAQRDGLAITLGDVTGDGVAEILVSTEIGSSDVRIFNGTGQLVRSFTAFGKTYRGGVSLAVGDGDRDGVNEVHIAKRAVEARVTTFSPTGRVLRSFRAFPTSYRSGVTLALGDVTGDGAPDVIVGTMQGEPKVRVLQTNGTLIRQFLAYDRLQPGGVSVAVGDVDGDGAQEIITGTGPGAKPEVRVWRNGGRQRAVLFNAFSKSSRTGVDVSILLRP